MLQQIIRRVRYYLHDIEQDRYSDAQIIDEINVAMLSLSKFNFFMAKKLVPSINGYIELPTDLVRLFRISYLGVTLEAISQIDLDIKNEYGCIANGLYMPRRFVLDTSGKLVSLDTKLTTQLTILASNYLGIYLDTTDLQALLCDSTIEDTTFGFNTTIVIEDKFYPIDFNNSDILFPMMLVTYSRLPVPVSLDGLNEDLNELNLTYLVLYSVHNLLLYDKDTVSIALADRIKQELIEEKHNLVKLIKTKHNYTKTNGEYRYSPFFISAANRR